MCYDLCIRASTYMLQVVYLIHGVTGDHRHVVSTVVQQKRPENRGKTAKRCHTHGIEQSLRRGEQGVVGGASYQT